MITKKRLKSILAIGMAFMLAALSPASVLADVNYTKLSDGSLMVYLSSENGTFYTKDFSNGTAAYVNQAAKSAVGTSALHQYFMSDTWIPGISSYTLGSNAAASALQYSGTGYNQMNAKKGQYNYSSDTWSKPGYTDGQYFLTYYFASEDNFIFRRNGERVRARQIAYVLEKYAERTGMKTKSSHKIRKTYASSLNANGVPLDEIRAQLGHTNLSTTMAYLFNPLTEKETYEKIKNAL